MRLDDNNNDEALFHNKNKAQMVTKIYRKWLKQSTDTERKEVVDQDNHALLIEALNQILHVWKQTRPNDRLDNQQQERYHEILNVAVETFKLTLAKARLLQSPFLLPRDKTFSSLLDLLASKNPSMQALSTARDLLQERMRLPNPVPDVRFWNSYLNVLAKCSSLDARLVDEAEGILDNLLGQEKADDRTVASVLEAWAYSGRREAGARAQYHLDRMLVQQQQQAGPPRLNKVCFNLTIRAWVTVGNMEQAESCLMNMIRISQQQQQQSRKVPFAPDASCFLTVARGWGKMGEPEMAEQVLNKMQSMYESTGDDRLRSSKEALVVLLHAWADGGNAGKKTGQILQASIDHLLDSPARDQADWLTPQAFTVAIKAWATTEDPDAPLHAQGLIKQMEQLRDAGFESLAPNHYHYSALINTWMNTKRNDVSNQVMDTLWHSRKKVGPHTSTYNSALSVLSKHGKVDEVEAIFEEMKRLQNDPTVTVGIDAMSYSSVIWAYYNNRHVEAATRSYNLLREAEDLFDTGSVHWRPTEALYLATILAQSIDSAEAAEDILWRMADRHKHNHLCPTPTAHICNAVLHVWARSNDGRGPQKAEEILQQMQGGSSHGLPFPNDTSYFNVMSAWGRSGRRSSVRHIVNLLSKMSNDRSLKVRETLLPEIEVLLEKVGRRTDTEDLMRALRNKAT